jgi:hypothetical protein
MEQAVEYFHNCRGDFCAKVEIMLLAYEEAEGMLESSNKK